LRDRIAVVCCCCIRAVFGPSVTHVDRRPMAHRSATYLPCVCRGVPRFRDEPG